MHIPQMDENREKPDHVIFGEDFMESPYDENVTDFPAASSRSSLSFRMPNRTSVPPLSLFDGFPVTGYSSSSGLIQ
jgi:hypothetical protein